MIQVLVRKIRVCMPSSFNKQIGYPIAVNMVIVVAGVLLSQTSGKPSSNRQPLTRIVLSHSLPKLDGRNLRVTVLEVSYGPGESSPPHSHPCPVIGYVLDGTLRMQMKGEAETLYRTGESFYEAPTPFIRVQPMPAARNQ